MSLSKHEQETGLTWDEATREVTIWTTSPVWRRKFTSQFGPGRSLGQVCTEWKVPLRELTIRKRSHRAPRVMTEAQKAALRKGRSNGG